MRNLPEIREKIRTIPNFPKAGIQFRDVSTLFKDSDGLRDTVNALVEHYKGQPIDKIVAIESRGFVLGGAIAEKLGCGLIMARKPGKLPGDVEKYEYQLEYGEDCIEIHKDAVGPGEKCLIVDDLLATGGTCEATAKVVESLGGVVMGCAFVVNLPDLKGSERLNQYDLHWLVEFGRRLKNFTYEAAQATAAFLHFTDIHIM